MLTRAYPAGNAPTEITQALATVWDVAAKASALEGEVASHTRKLEALERRGRALRAEIGRKVEELAHEESRVLREAAVYGEEEAAAKQEVARAEKVQRARHHRRSGGAIRPGHATGV
jgi:serine/threonine-protein kinase